MNNILTYVHATLWKIQNINMKRIIMNNILTCVPKNKGDTVSCYRLRLKF